MKMSKARFESLKADCAIVTKAVFYVDPEDVKSAADAWFIYHRINFHRSYPDDHLSLRATARILEPSHVDGPSWIHEMYDAEDLNDDHIKTALRRIFPNVTFK